MYTHNFIASRITTDKRRVSPVRKYSLAMKAKNSQILKDEKDFDRAVARITYYQQLIAKEEERIAEYFNRQQEQK